MLDFEYINSQFSSYPIHHLNNFIIVRLSNQNQ